MVSLWCDRAVWSRRNACSIGVFVILLFHNASAELNSTAIEKDFCKSKEDDLYATGMCSVAYINCSNHQASYGYCSDYYYFSFGEGCKPLTDTECLDDPKLKNFCDGKNSRKANSSMDLYEYAGGICSYISIKCLVTNNDAPVLPWFCPKFKIFDQSKQKCLPRNVVKDCHLFT